MQEFRMFSRILAGSVGPSIKISSLENKKTFPKIKKRKNAFYHLCLEALPAQSRTKKKDFREM